MRLGLNPVWSRLIRLGYSPARIAFSESAAYLEAHGVSPADDVKAAYAHYYALLDAHAHLLAFMDCFHMLGIITLVAAPLVLATKDFSLGGNKNTPAAHR